jgi:hypothetical protein
LSAGPYQNGTIGRTGQNSARWDGKKTQPADIPSSGGAPLFWHVACFSSWRNRPELEPEMFKQLATALVIVVTALPLSAAGAELTPLSVRLERRGFEQIKDQYGIKAYKHRRTDIIKIAAEGRVNAPPSAVVAAVLDYRGQVGIIKRLSASRVLDRDGCSLHVYQRLNLPVIDDRDFTLEVTWGNTGQTRWVRYRAVRGRGPGPQKGAVRVKHHDGSWQVRPLDGGRASWVRFQASIDMGGLLPMWLARSGAGKELPSLFMSVRWLAKQTHQQSKLRRVACISK